MQPRNALAMEVPMNGAGTVSGFMKGGEHRMALGSVVNGTQCTKASPKKVNPKASPLR